MRVKTSDLKLGMYVEIQSDWADHPFLRNRFKITSRKDLDRLRACPFDSVEVDLDRSEVKPDPAAYPSSVDELSKVSHGDAPVDPKEAGLAPPKWDPDSLIPGYLREALHDREMTPKQRAEQVYRHSRTMMKRLLESPTAENIKASKQAIYDVSDMVLSDRDTAMSMLRLTHHDFYTYTHSVNVGVLSIMLAKELYGGSDAHNMHELAAGFFLHDIGKVKVNPDILNKPAKLTDAEMKHIRIHPYQGYKILEAAGELTEECRIIVMQHHERAGGDGYPKALAGEEIHEYGRICCIADVFDALTAERSYKVAMTPFEALKLMKERMSDHFDQRLFAGFVKLFKEQ
ncbi:HD-GYP domain-containing protein [Motiliproteus sediminis]|uniref:HD-GYP domain-containing protein n=1 Tax=Motiliproteus sediminis TaxID=1468178 RepID=UPI001AEF9F4C|nr:HD-GYP domain-containing protein [Motiliproteus sediminis]